MIETLTLIFSSLLTFGVSYMMGKGIAFVAKPKSPADELRDRLFKPEYHYIYMYNDINIIHQSFSEKELTKLTKHYPTIAMMVFQNYPEKLTDAHLTLLIEIFPYEATLKFKSRFKPQHIALATEKGAANALFG